MTITLVTGPTMILLRDIALPRIINRFPGKLHTFKPSLGIPRMCSELECDGNRFIFFSNDYGIEKIQGLLFDKWIAFGNVDLQLETHIMSRLLQNNIETIKY